MPKKPCRGKGGLARCILQFIHLSKPIREKYQNHPKSHHFNNSVLITEAEKKIRKNSVVNNVYTFSHAYFKSVEFYSARRYVYFTK